MKNTKTIPAFISDEAAASFWESHDLTDYYSADDRVDLVMPNMQKTSQKRIQVPLPEWVIDRYKKIAQEKDISYIELIRSILTRSASRPSA